MSHKVIDEMSCLSVLGRIKIYNYRVYKHKLDDGNIDFLSFIVILGERMFWMKSIYFRKIGVTFLAAANKKDDHIATHLIPSITAILSGHEKTKNAN